MVTLLTGVCVVVLGRFKMKVRWRPAFDRYSVSHHWLLSQIPSFFLLCMGRKKENRDSRDSDIKLPKCTTFGWVF